MRFSSKSESRLDNRDSLCEYLDARLVGSIWWPFWSEIRFNGGIMGPEMQATCDNGPGVHVACDNGPGVHVTCDDGPINLEGVCWSIPIS